MTRPYTEAECRSMLLDHVRTLVLYWSGEIGNVPHEKSVKDRLDGLAFSLLVMLDGGTELPGFKVIPDPHPDDRQYHIDEGENWWPDDVDLAGGLHEVFCRQPHEL